ncbi:FkbM family methyltransferase [Phormidesmis priestleyi]
MTQSTEIYAQFLQTNQLSLTPEVQSRLTQLMEATIWDAPQSALDCSNVAVIALIEADQCEDLSMRTLYLETAIELLNDRVSDHPLCVAHLALIHSLIGDSDTAMQLAFPAFINILQAADLVDEPSGLIYLPIAPLASTRDRASKLEQILHIENAYTQALMVLCDVLGRSQLVFYNALGLRFLTLAAQFFPQSAFTYLQLGISSLSNQRSEGLVYLHRARQIDPTNALILQSLYLAYRDLRQLETASFWLYAAQSVSQKEPDSMRWKWSEGTIDDSMTYTSFEGKLLAVEATFRSIVTRVLIAEGDWFEKEMEFWRNSIQAGMTVIDVGANVGLYTFSAAQQVGKAGKVLAVEPFSGCVRCLQETCQINQLSQVKICAGAASDRSGTVRLALHSASEMNEVIFGDVEAKGKVEEVSCFTLDSLIKSETLDRVDFLKIDAEGHELQVLLGSDRILSEFAPVILYENIAGSKGSNIPVAEWLLSKGYRLFRYQPFLQNLVPIAVLEEFHGLNVIALPANKC